MNIEPRIGQTAEDQGTATDLEAKNRENDSRGGQSSPTRAPNESGRWQRPMRAIPRQIRRAALPARPSPRRSPTSERTAKNGSRYDRRQEVVDEESGERQEREPQKGAALDLELADDDREEAELTAG